MFRLFVILEVDKILGGSTLLFYYGMLAIGVVFFILGAFLLVMALQERVDSYFEFLKPIGMIVLGGLLLYFTLPSLIQMVTKDFKVVADECTVEFIDNGGRSGTSYSIDFKDGRYFSFEDGPYLDSYGEKVTYYCEVTQTKNEKFQIDYKVYDKQGGKVLAPIY